VAVLTNAQGYTLYWFAPDTPTRSACDGTCAVYWPPLTGRPVAGAGVTGRLGTIRRSDGTTQVAYDGHPLYTYVGDSAPARPTATTSTSTAAYGTRWPHPADMLPVLPARTSPPPWLLCGMNTGALSRWRSLGKRPARQRHGPARLGRVLVGAAVTMVMATTPALSVGAAAAPAIRLTTLSVSPSAGLVDGEQVTVRISDGSYGTTYAVAECDLTKLVLLGSSRHHSGRL